MTAFEKPRRQTSPAFLRFVRSKPCAVCGATPVDADHLATRGSGGSDFSTIPLDRVHHTERHQLGTPAFEARYRINVWRINAALLVEFFAGRGDDRGAR